MNKSVALMGDNRHSDAGDAREHCAGGHRPAAYATAPNVSIIIPNRNGAATIDMCLRAALASSYRPFEVIVVDDQSTDDSRLLISRFPCKLVAVDRHVGAAAARNIGASNARGQVLFFTDADCLLEADAVSRAAKAALAHGPRVVVGGTYTPVPYDRDFFSRFQSVFVNYSETKNEDDPDYVAAHAMIIHASAFRDIGGFTAEFLPVAEDVELSHRLRRAGCRLVVDPNIRARHVFGFTLGGSLRNAIFKSMYWTGYSLKNGDVLTDSGTASIELKFNVICCYISIFSACLFVLSNNIAPIYVLLLVGGANIFVSKGLLASFRRSGGVRFAITAAIYYLGPYPMAVGLGAVAGVVRYAWAALVGRVGR